MEPDVMELFGDREAEDAAGDSEGESEDEGPHNPMEEAIEVPEPGQEAAPGEKQPVKPKRVVRNPQPKLDVHRLAGPRGIFALQKRFKDVKFKGKGHEREDLCQLMRGLEHWAHRLFPKLPFKDTLEQIEKLGTQKNVQVHMKKLRLDMFVEEEGEDNVKRGPDQDDTQPTPAIDVFDELLGNNRIIPDSQPTLTPAQPTMTLTSDQLERMERNKKLALEKRLARVRQQQQLNMSQDQHTDNFDALQGAGETISLEEERETQGDRVGHGDLPTGESTTTTTTTTTTTSSSTQSPSQHSDSEVTPMEETVNTMQDISNDSKAGDSCTEEDVMKSISED